MILIMALRKDVINLDSDFWTDIKSIPVICDIYTFWDKKNAIIYKCLLSNFQEL